MKYKAILCLVVIATVLTGWLIFTGLSASRIKRHPPFFNESNWMRELTGKLISYGIEKHPDYVTTNIEALANASVFSVDELNFIRSHQITFHAFEYESSQTNVIPIIEGTFTNGFIKCLIVGYSDERIRLFD